MTECGQGAESKETHIVATDGKDTVLLPGERETVSMPGNKVSFVHREPESAYSMVEWASAGTPRFVGAHPQDDR